MKRLNHLPGILLAVAIFAGGVWLGRADRTGNTLALPEDVLKAAAAVGDERFYAATGPIDGDVEGLFTLDPLTGTLQCSVIYVNGPLASQVGAVFQHNISDDFPLDRNKQPHYLMLTGQANFPRGGMQNRPASSVCYVIEVNTGKFVAYGIAWNAGAVMAGQTQKGKFVLLGIGTVRPENVVRQQN
jgi:hypothetical protein